jgi:hypothetical protein
MTNAIETAAHVFIIGTYVKAGFAAIFLGALATAALVDNYHERQFAKSYNARVAARKQKKSK